MLCARFGGQSFTGLKKAKVAVVASMLIEFGKPFGDLPISILPKHCKVAVFNVLSVI